jgi:hypothetical protein
VSLFRLNEFVVQAQAADASVVVVEDIEAQAEEIEEQPTDVEGQAADAVQAAETQPSFSPGRTDRHYWLATTRRPFSSRDSVPSAAQASPKRRRIQSSSSPRARRV